MRHQLQVSRPVSGRTDDSVSLPDIAPPVPTGQQPLETPVNVDDVKIGDLVLADDDEEQKQCEEIEQEEVIKEDTGYASRSVSDMPN